MRSDLSGFIFKGTMHTSIDENILEPGLWLSQPQDGRKLTDIWAGRIKIAALYSEMTDKRKLVKSTMAVTIQ